MYPSKASQSQIEGWSEEEWEHFRQRLFDVSELMRNIQSSFARWYNRSYDRRGRFWADRFKSVFLETEEAVLDCMLYVELNPVRAGLVERPEDWRGSSIYLRDIGKASWLMPLTRICDQESEEKASNTANGCITVEAYQPNRVRRVFPKMFSTKRPHVVSRPEVCSENALATSSTAWLSVQSSSSLLKSPECARTGSISGGEIQYPSSAEYTCHFESNAALQSCSDTSLRYFQILIALVAAKMRSEWRRYPTGDILRLNAR
jgi:hypothetical protein